MTLYELKQEYLAALDGITVDEETGEAIFPAGFSELCESLDEKIESVALYRKTVAAEADAIRAEIKALKERRDAKDRKVAALDRYISDTMQNIGKNSFETARVALSFRSSEVVAVVDEARIPASFWRETVERSLDKAKIKATIKSGTVVVGAELVKRQNLQIK